MLTSGEFQGWIGNLDRVTLTNPPVACINYCVVG